MSSEARNPKTMHIDEQPTVEALRLILDEDASAIEVAAGQADSIAEAVDLAFRGLTADGSLHYFGAGASGRMAVLDATELGPTFGAPAGMVTAHFPGGPAALIDPSSDHEDSHDMGWDDASVLGPADVALGITASGGTPYVAGALGRARQAGAGTILLTCSAESSIPADVVIAMPTGPEAITGSTRLKAGTATKCALNAFSTALMVRMGRTYSNLMTGVTVTNSKLQGRAVRILCDVTDAQPERAREVLERMEWRTEPAIVHLLTGADLPTVTKALEEHSSIRRAVASLGGGR